MCNIEKLESTIQQKNKRHEHTVANIIIISSFNRRKENIDIIVSNAFNQLKLIFVMLKPLV